MKKHGFTLVEVTVVVSIIAFLLAVSLSVLSSVRRYARGTFCQGNIRHIGLAFEVYHATHDAFPSAFVPDVFSPDSVRDIPDYSSDWLGLWWFYYLDIIPNKFAPQKSILQCPSKSYSEVEYRYNFLVGNYGVNWSVCKSPSGSIADDSFPDISGSPMKLTSIMEPSRTLLLVDSGYALITWAQTLPDSHSRAPKTTYEAFNKAYLPGASVNAQKSLWPEQEEDARTGRHSGKTVNCLFTDGHIEKNKADDLAVQPLDHGQLGNVTPLWKPR